MAAVTVNSTKRSIFGDRRVQILNITGSSTNTYTPGWDSVAEVITSPGTAITAVSIGTTAPAVITFTAGGAITNEIIQVIGR